MSSKSGLERVKLVHNKKYRPSGPKSYVYLLHKYKFKPTQEGPYFVANRVHHQGKYGPGHTVGGKTHMQTVLQKKAADASQAGDVPAEDQQNDSQYLCHVTIGTPGQTFLLDFDTGSADLWLWSTELPSSTTSNPPSPHTIYDSTKSSTYNAVDGSTWRISYGDGSSASGSVGTDNVNIGGLVIKNQSIELANNLSTQFQQDTSDGLLGLAFGSINTVQPTPVKTPVENMISQDDIPQNQELFTAYLGAQKASEESFYTFGYLDQTALNGQTPTYTPVDNSQGFWMFESTSAVVAGKTIQRSGNTAIADTGTTLALVDDATCKAIYDAIPGGKYDSSQQGYVFPTDTAVAKLPVVSFAVGGEQFAVHKEDLAFADAGNGMSYGGIQSRGDMTFDILGDTFLKCIYAIFDQGQQRFGAVQRVDGSPRLSNLTPSEFLTSPEAMSPPKRKALLTRLESGSLKKICLDPAPRIEDSTITEYYDRVRLLLPENRDKLHVCIPFEKELKNIQDLKAKVDTLEKKLDSLQEDRLIMYQGNALLDLARMLSKRYRPGHTQEHSTLRLQQFAKNVTDAQLTEMRIPPKAWPLFRKLDQFIERRNKAAHETGGTFAQLLLENEHKTPYIFELWKDVFPVLYEATIQDLAAREGAERAGLLQP